MKDAILGYTRQKLWRLLVAAIPSLACELDVQLSPGELTAGSDAMGPSYDGRSGPYYCTESDLSGRFLLAVRLFEDEPPLQLSMCVVFDQSHTQSLSIIGWTRRLRPDDRRAYGDLDLFGGPAVGFRFELEPAVYWTTWDTVAMTLHLHGNVMDEDFLCGLVSVEISGPQDRPLGAMTFAAQRLDPSMPLPDFVAVDCSRQTLPAF